MDKNKKNGHIWRKKVEKKEKMCVFKEAEGAGVKGAPMKKREEGDGGGGGNAGRGDRESGETRSRDSDSNPAHRQLAHSSLSASHVGGREVS